MCCGVYQSNYQFTKRKSNSFSGGLDNCKFTKRKFSSFSGGLEPVDERTENYSDRHTFTLF